MSLHTETTIPLPDVEAVLSPLCEHMLEHDARVMRETGETTIALGEGLARMRAGPGGLSVAIEAPDLASLQELKRAMRMGLIGSKLPARSAALGLHALTDGLIQNWLLDPTAFDLVRIGRQVAQAYLAGLRADAPVTAEA